MSIPRVFDTSKRKKVKPQLWRAGVLWLVRDSNARLISKMSYLESSRNHSYVSRNTDQTRETEVMSPTDLYSTSPALNKTPTCFSIDPGDSLQLRDNSALDMSLLDRAFTIRRHWGGFKASRFCANCSSEGFIGIPFSTVCLILSASALAGTKPKVKNPSCGELGFCG